MTTTDPTANGDGVHRLIDMVVEEVSLVDRAANKHRFLLVKRNDAMDDETPADPTTPTETTSDGEPPASTPVTAPEAAPAAPHSDSAPTSSPLSTAVAALESLTSIVELLGSFGAQHADQRLAPLARDLRATAEKLLGQSSPDQPEPTPNAAVPQAATPASTGESPFAVDVTAAKQALARLSELAASAVPAVAQPPNEGATTEASLAKLAESFRTLSETVKTQHERLGRVEKQFGMPNSAGPAEQVAKVATDVGWPLDLNKPMDRENVDKAVSFHDL